MPPESRWRRPRVAQISGPAGAAMGELRAGSSPRRRPPPGPLRWARTG
jgi:hypothetical protein